MRQTLLAILLVVPAARSHAAAFMFGSGQSGIAGRTQAIVTREGFAASLSAFPSGAVFDERSTGGIGVNSRGLPGIIRGQVDSFDVIEAGGPFAGQGESVEISFDRPGVLTAIDLDGVKDESLEYFVLTTESGLRYEFFDSAANFSVPGAVDRAVAAGVVTGEVVYLLEGGGLDDEVAGLAIPFHAGEKLTLTYAELGAPFGALQAGNGSRLQGFTVTEVPEPLGAALVGVALVLSATSRGRRGV